MRRANCLAAASLLIAAIPVVAAPIDETQVAAIEYRNLGPYRVGAWVADFAVPANGREHLYTYYVALRSGGVWKTVNNGTTFEPVFDGNGVQAIGAVTVAPSDNNIVWVGTGDNANARSSHAGIGVFRSEDGGQSWQHMGLRDTQHIARIAIHPSNSNIVYVAAIGHLFSRNEQRGLFRSVDGGRNWDKVLYVSDGVGVVDVIIDPADADTVYAATYEMKRLPWHFDAGGPASAIYKSGDGGENWTRLTGGLPQGDVGRIGIDICRSTPDVLYAIYENLELRDPFPEEADKDREAGKEPQRRRMGGEVYRSEDRGEIWSKTHDDTISVGDKAPYSFNQIDCDPNDNRKVFVTSEYVANSSDGGATWHDLDEGEKHLFGKNFGDVRTLWIDPRDSNRILFGSDGGVYVSYDGGRTSDFRYNIPGGEFYAVGVDLDDPYNLYGGLQDHESWKGPVNSWSGAVTLEDWVLVGLWDGMYNQVDQTDNRYLYTTAQFGGHHRVDQVNGTRTRIQPEAAEGEPKRRYPWTPAIQVSPHNPDVVYAGSQKMLKSVDRGDTWLEISPDLTHQTPVEDGGHCVDAGGGQGWINFCTVTSLDESPIRAGVIWAGTDDGRVHVTEDGGASWRDVTAALADAGAPADFWVSRVRSSRHDVGTAYVTKNGMRFDRFEPQVYRSTDFGRSWTSLAANLPASPVNVIVDDSRNPALLFLGNDQGVWFSLDAGGSWNSLQRNMPTVPVKDLVIHPRENDLVAATYGRGLYVADVSPLQQMTAAVLAAPLHLFDIESNVIHRSKRQDWGSYHMRGDSHLATPNEPAGFAIYYLLGEEADEVTLDIESASGDEVTTLPGTTTVGLNRVQWDTSDVENIEPGEYRVVLTVDGNRLAKSGNLRPPRAFAIGPASGPMIVPR